MKFLLRILGTWFVGLALILMIMDGTRSFSAGSLELTSLGQLWAQLHQTSWEAVVATLLEYGGPLLGRTTIEALVAWPSWVFFLGFGSLFMVLGRRARKKRFLSPY